MVEVIAVRNEVSSADYPRAQRRSNGEKLADRSPAADVNE